MARNDRLAPPMSEMSYMSAHSVPPSEASFMTSRTSRSGKVKGKIQVVENPLCPRIQGLCCLMVLFNLALLLICLGFTLVLQFFEPGFVWYLGIFMLVFGFLTLVGSFIYCIFVCQEHRQRQTMNERYGSVNGEPPLVWNREWRRSEFGSNSEINYDNKSGRSVGEMSKGHPYYVDNEKY